MVKEAEANAAEDKKRRELVEARNQGEALIHSTEKSLAEHGDKVGRGRQVRDRDGDRRRCRTALEGEDVEAIKAKTNALMQASMKLGEAMYEASQAEAGGRRGRRAGARRAPKKDDVVDADFQEVDDDKKKSA